MEHPCMYEFCTFVAKSEKKLNLHMIMQHEVYTKDRAIYEGAIRTLTDTKKRVEFLMRRYASCRNSDVVLIIEFMRRWGLKPDNTPLFIYEDQSKDVVARGKYKEWHIVFSIYENVRRSREAVQNPEIRKKHKGLPYDQSLMPSEKVEQIRMQRSRAYHNFFASEKLGDWLPETYVPEGGSL